MPCGCILATVRRHHVQDIRLGIKKEVNEMIDYLNMKRSYIATIQVGLALNAGYEEAKRGNDLLHKFCENCVDNSLYGEADKRDLKRDLEIVKDALSQEIELRFHGAQQ